MVYKYLAYTSDERITDGTIEAASESLAEQALFRAGYELVISLKKVNPAVNLEQLIPSLYGVKARDIIDFSRQLATLLESGISILIALRLLEVQIPKAALKKVLAGLMDELQDGQSFSQAASKYPQVFSNTYRQMIRASEQTGNLQIGLRQIAAHMEKRMAIGRKTGRAVAYPAMVLALAFGVFILLTTVALPPLVGLFNSLGAELPLTTRMVLSMTAFLTDYQLYLVGGASALIIFMVVFTRLPVGKISVDRLFLSLPVIGTINIQRHMAHLCRTASMLLGVGLRLPQILDIVAPTIGNRVIRQALIKVEEKLVQGQGLSQPMAEIALFPPLMVEMVVVGESTGTLDATLATVADLYEESVDQRIQTLISLIEPVLTVIVGLIVVYVALAMIAPLYSILNSI